MFNTNVLIIHFILKHRTQPCEMTSVLWEWGWSSFPHFRVALLQLSSSDHLTTDITVTVSSSTWQKAAVQRGTCGKCSPPREGSPGYHSNLQGKDRAVWMETRQEGRLMRSLIFRGSELFGQLSCSCKYSHSSSNLPYNHQFPVQKKINIHRS